MQKSIFSNPIAIEIKSSNNPSVKDFDTLKKFKKDNPNAKLFVIPNWP